MRGRRKSTRSGGRRKPSQGFGQGAALLGGAGLVAALASGCDAGFFVEPSPEATTLELRVSADDGAPLPTARAAETEGPGRAGEDGGGDPDVAAQSVASVFEQVTTVLVVLESGGEVLAEEAVAAEPSGGEIRVVVEVELQTASADADLELSLETAQGPVFEGGGTVTLSAGPRSEAEVDIEPIVDDVVLEEPEGSVESLGDTLLFTGSAIFATGDPIPGAPLTWTSRAPEVLEVSSDGVGVARGEGEARVVASFQEHQDSVQVQVNPVVAEVEVVPAQVEVEPGESADLAAEARDARGNVIEGRSASWTSADPHVATVDGGGVVTGVRPGATQLRATVDEVDGQASVDVLAVPPEATTLQAADIETDAATIRGRVNPKGQPAEVWFEVASSRHFHDARTTEPVEIPAGIDDETVSQRVRHLRFSTTYYYRVLASNDAGDSEGEVRQFTTADLEVAEIHVSPKEAAVVPGETVTFEAEALDGDGQTVPDAPIEWSVDDGEVAEVDGNGTVTGLAPGQAQVRASFEGVEDDAYVAVLAAPPDVVTDPARNVGENQADLVGRVNPRALPAVAWFELSPDPEFTEALTTTDPVEIPAGTEDVEVTETVGHLSSGTTYYFRALGANEEGTSVGDLEEFTTDWPTVDSIHVIPQGVEMAVGWTQQFDAEAWDAHGQRIHGIPVNWSTDDPDVATVDDAGLVTAEGAGETWVRAERDGAEGRAFIWVGESFGDDGGPPRGREEPSAPEKPRPEEEGG